MLLGFIDLWLEESGQRLEKMLIEPYYYWQVASGKLVLQKTLTYKGIKMSGGCQSSSFNQSLGNFRLLNFLTTETNMCTKFFPMTIKFFEPAKEASLISVR